MGLNLAANCQMLVGLNPLAHGHKVVGGTLNMLGVYSKQNGW